MTAALKALSPDELMALERIVAKLEASAKAEARDVDADDDDGSRRRFRRAHFRGEVSAAVDEVEAVAAPDEADLTAEADGAFSPRGENEPGDLTKPE